MKSFPAYLLLIASLALSLIACSENSTEPNTDSGNNTVPQDYSVFGNPSESYFPLVEGATWTYELEGGYQTMTFRVSHIDRLNDNLYAVMYADGGAELGVMRSDGTGNYYSWNITRPDGCPDDCPYETRFIMEAPQGTSWGDRFTIEEKGIVWQLAGRADRTFTDVIIVRQDIMEGDAVIGSIRRYFAKGIGLIEIASEDYPYAGNRRLLSFTIEP